MVAGLFDWWKEPTEIGAIADDDAGLKTDVGWDAMETISPRP